MVNKQSLVVDIFGWETDIGCLFVPFIQEEVKMKPFRYQVSGIRIGGLTDIMWEKKVFSSVSYHKKGIGDVNDI